MGSHRNELRMRALGSAAAAGLIAFAGLPGTASAREAQDTPAEEARTSSGGLEEIIVTAQRRQESQQEVPIAVATVTAQALENSGIDATRDLPRKSSATTAMLK